MQPGTGRARAGTPTVRCHCIQVWHSFAFWHIGLYRDELQQKCIPKYIDRMQQLRSLITLSPRSWLGLCQVCNRWPAQPVCSECLARFAPLQQRCITCAVNIIGTYTQCGACLTSAEPSPISRCVAALDYGYPWDRLIARWKFGGETGWSWLWSQLLWRDAQTRALWQQASHVMAVPVGPNRLVKRGFNQAWELTKALHRQAGAASPAALPQGLVRLRETADQHTLPRAQRLRNLQGVFAPHPRSTTVWRGGHVLVVDDVMTTGATLHAAAQCLLDAGAQRVSALVLARTPLPD